VIIIDESVIHKLKNIIYFDDIFWCYRVEHKFINYFMYDITTRGMLIQIYLLKQQLSGLTTTAQHRTR